MADGHAMSAEDVLNKHLTAFGAGALLASTHRGRQATFMRALKDFYGQKLGNWRENSPTRKKGCSMKPAKILAVAMAACLFVFSGGGLADTNSRKLVIAGNSASKPIPPGQIQRQKSGYKPVPPGQIKRYTRGSKLPLDVIIWPITDLSKWKLKPLGPGEEYVRVDSDLLKIEKDTRTVLEAIGIVGDYLK
ncbi:MAG: hypothetical protein HKP40_07165 [Litoreibacter sp.]|nr:hypothetical protein [Litoreibacter sp.]